jgi:hypothetical protein
MLDRADTIVVEDSAVRTLPVADHEILVEIKLDGASDPVCKYKCHFIETGQARASVWTFGWQNLVNRIFLFKP